MRRKKTTDALLVDRRWLSRRDFVKKMGFASLGCAIVLTPGILPAWRLVRGETIRERNEMDLARNTTAPEVSIPPIDAAAPTATETATFAMG